MLKKYMHYPMVFIFIIASSLNAAQMVREFASEAEFNAAEKKRYEQALLHEANWNNLSYLKHLLTKNIDINVTDEEGNTALIRAVNSSKPFNVDALIKAHVDLNIMGNWEYTALISAIWSNQFLIAHKLIDAGADVDVQTCIGKTALHFAARKGNKDLIVALLSKTGHLNDQCSEGKTFLSILGEKHPELMQDPQIQKALENYEKRRIAHAKKEVAPRIVENVKEVHFLPGLAEIVAEYAVENF